METQESAQGLCEWCCRLFEALESDATHFTLDPFHESDAALEHSLDAGCPICSALRYKSERITRDYVSFNRVGGCTDVEFRIILPAHGEQDDCKHMTRFVVCRVEDDEAFFSQCERAWSSHDSGSEENLELAATLLYRCVESHDDCIGNRQPSSYPTRLLDIENDTIRLVDSSHSHISGPYATLSHTWGDTDIKVLTLQTLSEYRNGIEHQDIPLTFQNAITVARKLNIRYLWIDCYCIIQSGELDSKDKLAEISKMGEVYSKAIVNIGAGAATSPLEGLFVNRSRRSPIRIDFTSKARKRTSTYLLYSQHTLGLKEHFFFTREHNSILSRAWCMQERFLCPRMLHFSGFGMFWECQAIEMGSQRLPTQAYPGRREGDFNYLPFSMHKGSQRSRNENLRDWDQNVSLYSAMELSRADDDKLVACGAVAKAMAELLGDEYVAGFFRRSLILSLPWVVLEATNHGLAPRSKKWRAPSWSWASMDGRASVARMDDEPANPCAQLINFDRELIDPSNLYGGLRSAMIVVKGPVLQVEYDISESPDTIRLEDTEMDVYFDDQSDLRQDLLILLTHIRDHHSYPSGSLAERQLSGLVLAPVSKPSHERTGIFQRVGAFRKGSFRLKSRSKSRQMDPNDVAMLRIVEAKVFHEANERVITII